MENLIINLISGAVGANAAGAADKKQDLGLLWNTVIGILGGLAGSTALQNVIASLLNNTLGDILGSAACGAIAIYLVNFIKNLTNKKA